MNQLDYKKYGITSDFEIKRAMLPAEENPALCQWTHCQEFTQLSQMWRRGELPDTPAKEICDIEEVFYTVHEDLPWVDVGAVWEETEQRFMRNPGFASYYARFCMRSEYYPRWPLNVPTALAVVGPFGYGWDLSGGFDVIPMDDDHAWWTEHHPMMLYMRNRGKNSACLVQMQHEQLRERGVLAQRKQRILVLSAGYIPWLTMLNYRADPETQEIVACDMDPRMSLRDLRWKFGAEATAAVSEYRICKNEELFADSALWGKFDIALLDGGYIYYPLEYRAQMLDAMLRMVCNGGMVVYDDQCEHWAMDFARELFNWGETMPIQLMSSPEAIKKSVDFYTRNRDMSSEIYYDAANDEPVGGTVVLRRVSQR